MDANYRIVFVRHGESEWSSQERISGWHDDCLTEKGIEEARQVGKVSKSFK
jgi:2,3-bisphosphoglycerate-dependent phosphoglycerate mutase